MVQRTGISYLCQGLVLQIESRFKLVMFHDFRMKSLALLQDEKLQLSFDMAAGKCDAENLSLEEPLRKGDQRHRREDRSSVSESK